MNRIESLYSHFQSNPLICTDTRKIEAGCIFFALKGPNFNANTFAAKAIELGAALAVIDEPAYESDKTFLVNDVLQALQDLATHHRNQLQIPVIAIAGSNGKTTTKELISSVLGEQFHVLATPGNLNNHIGLPLTLLQITPAHNMAVIEMGANHIGENELLCRIARPDYGIVTNNGKDHLEGFGSIEGVIQSNAELYEYLQANHGTAFVNAADQTLMQMAENVHKKILYAAGPASTAVGCVAIVASLQPSISFSWGNTSISSMLSGDYNLVNIMAAVCIGAHFGMDASAIKRGVEKYVPSNNRSQVIKKAHSTIYLDAYNANPSSMEASLRNFAAMPFNNKVVIIGDMFELGKYKEEEHRNLIAYCHKLGFEQVILVGEAFHAQNHDSGYQSFITTEEARSYLDGLALKGANVFLKGSRGMKMESLMEVIS